jgi:antitoxin ParD1/3/4
VTPKKLMSIILTSDQERLIQSKLQAGKYQSAEEVLEAALWLLEEYDRADTEWVQEMREKIDVALFASEETPPVDGEVFVNQMLEKLRQSRLA